MSNKGLGGSKSPHGKGIAIIAILIAIMALIAQLYPFIDLIDIDPPVVGLLDPDDEQIISGNFTIRAVIYEMSNFSLSISLNNTIIGNSLPLEINSTAFEDGFYNLKITANDTSGNSGFDNVKINILNNLTGLDSDHDGLSDEEEMFIYGTDPYLVDTDNDNFNDAYEIKLNTDPLNDTDYPFIFGEKYNILLEYIEGNATLLQNLIEWSFENSTIIEDIITWLDGNATLLQNLIEWSFENSTIIEDIITWLDGNATLIENLMNITGFSSGINNTWYKELTDYFTIPSGDLNKIVIINSMLVNFSISEGESVFFTIMAQRIFTFLGGLVKIFLVIDGVYIDEPYAQVQTAGSTSGYNSMSLQYVITDLTSGNHNATIAIFSNDSLNQIDDLTFVIQSFFNIVV